MKPVLSPLDGMIASISPTEVHIQEIKDGTKNTTVSLLDYIDQNRKKYV